MKRITIKHIFANSEQYFDKQVTVSGWVKTLRDSKVFGFIELNDGSCFKNLQIVFEQGAIDNFEEIAKLNVGSSVWVEGVVVATPQNKQPLEIKATKITIEGKSTPDYPLQKKRHTVEYL
ncbi:MAG: asparagine--tRNA ligase, partial [Clostridia bacterium]|nr:asparagine--tRNA ligase [Clostridia bacterium]